VIYAIETGSGGIRNIEIFTQIFTDVQAVLKVFLSNLKGCSVGITNGKDMRCKPLK
jgi:hypothetical protein